MEAHLALVDDQLRIDEGDTVGRIFQAQVPGRCASFALKYPSVAGEVLRTIVDEFSPETDQVVKTLAGSA